VRHVLVTSQCGYVKILCPGNVVRPVVARAGGFGPASNGLHVGVPHIAL
jgi:hypothetical protein